MESMNNLITEKQKARPHLQEIPGIGKACSGDLWNIGIREISDLAGQNPAVLYNRLNMISGVKHDICMLYTFQCAVYFATEEDHERENFIGGTGKTKPIMNRNQKIYDSPDS